MSCKRTLSPLALLLAVALMAGCATVGPDYQKPQTEMADAWQTQADPAMLPQQELVQQWWTLFNDPVLNRLIEKASKGNLDLLVAVARVDETRARLGVASGEQFPDLDASGDVTRHQSRNHPNGVGYEETLYNTGLGASWELDLFGRIRRSVQVASAEYEATEEDRTDVLISVYASVSEAYLGIRTAQARLAAAHANIASQREILGLTRVRFKHGLATDLDVAQAERFLASAESQVPPLRISMWENLNNLAVLLGQRPGTLQQELMQPAPIPLPPTKATVGVPADLLRQRPDIRGAERRLAAQTARIGVATADLYPRFSLSGTFGYEAVNSQDLFNPASQIFSFGPSLRWNIFSGGSIRNEIKAQDALTRQTLLAYEQSVLNALREVENALKAYVEDRVRLEALERSVAAARRSVKLSINLYKQGLVDFQPVLDAQRDQFDFENQLAVAKGDSAANFVRLYTALGGGWNPGETKKQAANNAQTTLAASGQ